MAVTRYQWMSSVVGGCVDYDYIIVGSGLFGAVFAERAAKAGKRCLIVERRSHIGGNCFTEKVEGIDVHRYGAHIFHTSNREIWEYVNRFSEFNNFVNSPMANYQGRLYNLPFNMNTFYAMWGVNTPRAARERIELQRRAEVIGEPKNLEEQAISLVGRDIYEILVKGYTQKQWGRPCKELPASIIKRLPVRLTFDNNYFNDRWQGIPIKGYTALIKAMIGETPIMLNTDFLKNRDRLSRLASRIVYTGPIDEYFNFCFGPLAYRSLRFETQTLACENYQGVAVMNFTGSDVPYTRVIEHKHFNPVTSSATVVTWEYPADWKPGEEPYYPVNDVANSALYAQYCDLAAKTPNILFGGRLGMYRYFDMDKVVFEALRLADREFGLTNQNKGR